LRSHWAFALAGYFFAAALVVFRQSANDPRSDTNIRRWTIAPLKHEKFMKAPIGRVYILTNAKMPGLVKIGFTLGTVEGRAKELHGTGTPVPFEIAYQVEVRDPSFLETRVHTALGARRVNGDREFFEIDAVEAIISVRNFAADRIDEELHPKYAASVDETARTQEEKLKRKRESAEQAEQAKKEKLLISHRQSVERLSRDLKEAKARLSEAPMVPPVTASEHWSWVLLCGVVICLWAGAHFLLTPDPPPDYLAGAGFLGTGAFLYWLRGHFERLRKEKEVVRQEVRRLQVEVENFEYDIEQLQKKKPNLEPDFTPTRARVVTDDRGFEMPARNRRTG